MMITDLSWTEALDIENFKVLAKDGYYSRHFSTKHHLANPIFLDVVSEMIEEVSTTATA